MKPDPRIAIVEAALKAASVAIVARDATILEGIAVVAAAMSAGTAAVETTPRENVIAARQTQRAAMLAELAKHDGPSGAMTVARKFAVDRHDPVEIATLAAKLRRWRKKFGRFPNFRADL